ncbi:MAG TPA: ATP-binding protein [Polyangiaceae bacterium]|nr:ATP-binding protein [Polyangiaceae bacterium]
MDLRTRTSLFCGALALAIAASILLRGRPRRAQYLFAAFAADIGLWYIAQWLYHFVLADVWARFTAVLAVLMPQFGLHLFEAIFPTVGKPSRLLRVAGVLLIPITLLVLLPHHEHPLIRFAVFVYAFGLFAAGLWTLLLRGERSQSRATQKRVRFLVFCGALAATFSLADFMWFIGAPLPPVGAVLSIVFLFVLAESLIRDRLVDHYEMLGWAVVSTALAFSWAGIFYLFVVLMGRFQNMYLNAVLGGIVMLVLFEPLRDKVSAYIHRAFFLERVDLERAVTRARREMARVLHVEEMMRGVVSALEDSRRVTSAVMYRRDPLGEDFELGAQVGVPAPQRIDSVAARPLLEQLGRSGSVNLEEVAKHATERRRAGDLPLAEEAERLLAAAQCLGPLENGLCLGVRAKDGELLAILGVIDDRVRDAFSSEDVQLLETLAMQAGIVIDNSREYQKMQERERLAALGELAAGLAHEVKNPLGAIKGAAQLLADPADGKQLDAHSREFLQIILEEVERLDRVVGSVLDYARPTGGKPGPIDVNAVVKRTVVLLTAEYGTAIQFNVDLPSVLPKVRGDAEQLRQVLINLIQNAVQAMQGRGEVTIKTGERMQRGASFVTIAISDRGPGIAPAARKSLFTPFFTTKEKGTGLGLAISARAVQEMGGRIDVQSGPDGATFVVLMPVEPAATELRGAVATEADLVPAVPERDSVAAGGPARALGS